MATLTFVTFLPSLSNGFGVIDDGSNLVNNPHYRGLGWSNLRWMFTTMHGGHYRPGVWVTFGFDYLIWGMNPFGYHLTSLLIHVANAVFFYFISKRLLALALPSNDDWRLTIGAGFAALLFAIHPLRVETIALVTDRKELLSTFFFLWTISIYLRARPRWIIAALITFTLSLLSKATAMTLPMLLLILDYYPLRRLQSNPRLVLLEKVSFVAVALPFALIALFARQGTWSLVSEPLRLRPLQALYTVGFYPWKTFVLWELPPHFSMSNPSAILCVVFAITLTVGFYLLRIRFPAGLACWLFMCVALGPVLGLVQEGQYFMADRYSYLSCLSWSVLAGGLLTHLLRASVQARREKRRHDVPRLTTVAKASALAALGVLLLLVSMTWQRTPMWKDEMAFWTRIIEVDANSFHAHYYLAIFFDRRGRYNESLYHFGRCLQIDPNHVAAHQGLAIMSMHQGNYAAAIQHYRRTISLGYDIAEQRYDLATALAKQGNIEEALVEFQTAAGMKPIAEAHAELAKILSRQGEAQKAEAHFRRAIELDPNLPFCVLNTCL